jgi:predicted DNA-binding protein (UPF0251 family)
MQQALLSGMMMRKPEEASSKAEQDVKPREFEQATEQQSARLDEGRAVQHRTPAPRPRQSKQLKPQPSWFEGRGDSHHLSQRGVQHLRRLFDQGLSQSEAARQMGITPAAVRRRFREWGEKQAA